MFRFTIRELILLTVVVAMGAAWWVDNQSLTARWERQLIAERQSTTELNRLREEYNGYRITMDNTLRKLGGNAQNKQAAEPAAEK